MHCLLLLMIFRSTYGLIYEKEENRKISAETVIHTENNVTSELTCAHICLRLNGDALYTKKKCLCLRKVNIISNDSPFITGTYMKKTEKDEMRKDEMRMKDMGPIPMKENQQIAIISKMMKTFHIQAKFEVDKSKLITSKWHNLFRITNGKQGSFGYVHPGIFLNKRSSNQVKVEVQWPDAGTSSKSTYFYDLKGPSFFDSSFKVDYIQKETSNGYFTRILLNDDEVVKRTYSNPREFENLIVYAGDPWHSSIENSKVYVRFIEGIELKWRFDE